MTAPPNRLASPNPPVPPGRDARRRRGTARFVTAAVFTLIIAIPTVPDLLFGLDRRSPFVQLVSMRPWILAVVLALLVLLLVVLVFERRVWPFVAGVLAVLLIGGGVVLPRVLPDPVRPAGGRFRVMAVNTYAGE